MSDLPSTRTRILIRMPNIAPNPGNLRRKMPHAGTNQSIQPTQPGLSGNRFTKPAANNKMQHAIDRGRGQNQWNASPS